jgi:hypothetical protein
MPSRAIKRRTNGKEIARMMTPVTKMDIVAMRKADRLVLWMRDAESYVHAVKENRPTERDPFACDIVHVIAAPVRLQTDWQNEAHNPRCCASINFYRSSLEHAASILATLRTGDEISFEFYADAHTNGYMREAGLHGDVLYMDVTRAGKRVARFQLDYSNCSDNTARMIQGVYQKREIASATASAEG